MYRAKIERTPTFKEFFGTESHAATIVATVLGVIIAICQDNLPKARKLLAIQAQIVADIEKAGDKYAGNGDD